MVPRRGPLGPWQDFGNPLSYGMRLFWTAFALALPIFEASGQTRVIPRVRYSPGVGQAPAVTLRAPAPGPLTLPNPLPAPKLPDVQAAPELSAPAGAEARSAPGSSFWASFFDRAPALAAGPELGEVRLEGGKLYIQGRPAASLGAGTYKETFEIPHAPDFVLKLFTSRLLRPEENLPEKRREVENTRRLEKAGATPRLTESGALSLDRRTMGYLVVERVRGRNLAVMTPAKREAVRKLFSDLLKAGLELDDVKSLAKVRQNIMVGETRSGGFKAYVVDADLKDSRKSRAELSKFYADLLESLGGDR